MARRPCPLIIRDPAPVPVKGNDRYFRLETFERCLVSTLSGRSSPRPLTPLLGGERAFMHNCGPRFSDAPHFWRCNLWIAGLVRYYNQNDCDMRSTPRDNRVPSTAHLRIKCGLLWRKE